MDHVGPLFGPKYVELEEKVAASRQLYIVSDAQSLYISKNSVILVISPNGEKLNLAFFSRLAHLRCGLSPHGDGMWMNDNSTRNDGFDGRFM